MPIYTDSRRVYMNVENCTARSDTSLTAGAGIRVIGRECLTLIIE